MALDMYKINEDTAQFEVLTSDALSNPLHIAGRHGGTTVTKIFLRNDSELHYYEDIIVKPVVLVGGGDIQGNMVVIKILSGQKRPSETEWAAANSNSACTISSPQVVGFPSNTRIPNLGDENTPDTNYYPIWVSVSVARGAPMGSYNYGLSISYTELNVA